MTTIDMEDSELFGRIVEEYIVENGEDFVDVKAPKKRRVARSSRLIDFYKTKWGVLLTDPNTRVHNTYQGKLFRRRFRVPFQVFDEVLLPMCKEYNVFGNGHNSSWVDFVFWVVDPAATIFRNVQILANRQQMQYFISLWRCLQGKSSIWLSTHRSMAMRS